MKIAIIGTGQPSEFIAMVIDIAPEMDMEVIYAKDIAKLSGGPTIAALPIDAEFEGSTAEELIEKIKSLELSPVMEIKALPKMEFPKVKQIFPQVEKPSYKSRWSRRNSNKSKW